MPVRHQRKRVARGGLQLNMTSMIDVVFLLLMYFLLATNFSLGEELFHLDMPAPLGSFETDPFDLPEQPVRITVDTTGPGASDYRITIGVSGLSATTFESLYRTLDDAQANDGNPDGIFLPDTPLVIQPGSSCRWEHAVNTLNACLRAKYEQVQFAGPDEG